MLTRLHMPAGKAVALAAMPTAVLMGMGLTPQLAQADPKSPGPFKPGKCVSQPDEAEEQQAEKEKDEAEKAEEEAEEAAEQAKEKEEAAKGEDGASSEPSGSASPEPGPSGSAGSDQDEEAGEAEPAPSGSETKNPLDPLGLGDSLKNLFGGGSDAEEAEAEEPEASAEPSAGAEDEPPDSGAPLDDAREGVEDTVGGVTDGAKSAAEKAAEKAEKAKEEAEKAAEGAQEALPGDAAAEDGLQPFPCPEYDPQALADAELERTPLLPDDPWTLESSKLSLHGLDYQGIVKVKTWSGEVKEVLKFTAKGVDIKDLHQLVVGPNGTTSHVKAAEGSNSTIRNGEVTMYTEELKGNLLGIIPITFSPKSPPPLNIPEVFFTHVTVTQAGQFGGELTVPGMHLYNEA